MPWQKEWRPGVQESCPSWKALTLRYCFSQTRTHQRLGSSRNSTPVYRWSQLYSLLCVRKGQMGEALPLTESEAALLVLDCMWLVLQWSSQKGSGNLWVRESISSTENTEPLFWSIMGALCKHKSLPLQTIVIIDKIHLQLFSPSLCLLGHYWCHHPSLFLHPYNNPVSTSSCR